MVLRHLVAMLGWDVDLKTALGAEDDATRACHEAVETLLQNLTPQEEDFAAFLGERGLVVTAPLATTPKPRCAGMRSSTASHPRYWWTKETRVVR